MAFAVIDCENFYVSCERVFQPRLRGRPVVVLSNNDGCVISRSEEAKAAGVSMGVPLFEARPVGLYLINNGYHLAGLLGMGAMLAAWRRREARVPAYQT